MKERFNINKSIIISKSYNIVFRLFALFRLIFLDSNLTNNRYINDLIKLNYKL